MKQVLIKKWYVIGLLIMINGFLLMGVISPLIEKNQYYQMKADELQKKLNNLEKYKLYQKYHTKRFNDLEKQYLSLKKHWSKIKPDALETYLRINQRQLKLELKSQNIESNKDNSIFSFEIIQQNLTGEYEPLLKYLKLISSDQLPVLLLEFELLNMEPDKQAPILSANIKFRYFKL